MTDWASLGDTLAQRRRQHLYRQRPVLDGPQGATITVDGETLLNFCSNDYLGLANHPEVVAAFRRGADEYGVGSGASHLVCGHTRLHHQLEETLAAFVGRDRALVFSTGYMANLGVVTALLGKGDYVFEDRLNHASLLDAGLMCGARFQRFPHNDADNLDRRLQKVATDEQARKLIVVDSVFSMDGDCAPLDTLSALAQRHRAGLMIDDAHGFGVLGARGAGSSEHFGLDQSQLPILMATLGKAVGGFGAFVAGSDELIETLIQFARPYIYTTALPPAVAAAALASLDIIQGDSARRERLHGHIRRFRVGAAAIGLQLPASDSAIQPVVVGDSDKALRLSRSLRERGFYVAAIRPPTVPANTARLRITLSAAHSERQIDQLLDALGEVAGA